MSFQRNLKGHVLKKQAWRPPIFMFYFDFLSYYDCECKKFNHNFNYTHTSLIDKTVSEIEDRCSYEDSKDKTIYRTYTRHNRTSVRDKQVYFLDIHKT